MYFKRLEIHGFKSFAEPVVIDLHRGVTCVVGPNGSGKSNICDAIRWVLGAQSAKMLRGDKMEDVIFAGTANRRSRGMAEVTLVIDNSTGILPIEYNEVAITRRMYRSGESEYLINNNQCRMKDIRELIMDTGIGVEGYSIIGQGKIADIISNNTESIREILEETAGIVMYRSKKADAERKLKVAETNIDRVNDIVGEIEGRIDGLREDSEKAEEYLKLQERYKELEINITLKNVESIELKNEYIKDDIIQLQGQLEEEKEKREGVIQSLAKTMSNREELDTKMAEASKKHLVALSRVNELVNQGQVNKERLSAIEAGYQQLTKEIEEIESKLKAEESNSYQLLNSRDIAIDELKIAQAELEDRQSKYREMSQRVGNITNSIDQNKNSLFDIQGEINLLRGELATLENLKETLSQRHALLIGQGTEANLGKSKLQEELERVEAEQNIVAEESKKIKEELEQLASQKNRDKKREQYILGEIENLRVDISRLGSRKKTFEELESNYDGYNSAVKFLMKNISDGNMGSGYNTGIHGVVAELIKVPAGFEVAIETAMGATLQNIICKDDQTAKKVINHLKEHKAGRLTFLPLESIRPREIRREDIAINAKGFKGYGVDCISFDNKYRSAIEYLLGNVIVVDNMDNAITLSRNLGGRNKFVTLEGEIINVGGAITGGRYRNKSANILERRVEIQSLGRDITKNTQTLDEKLKELEEIKGGIASKEARIVDLAIREKKASEILVTKQSEITMVKGTLQNIDTSEEKATKELAQIFIEQENSDITVKEIKEKIAKANEKQNALRAEIEKATEEHQKLRMEEGKLQEELTQGKIKVSTCQSEQEKIQAIASKVQETLDNLLLEKNSRQERLTAQSIEKERIMAGYNDNSKEILEEEKNRDYIASFLEELAQEKAQGVSLYEEETKIKDQLDVTLEALQNQKYELEIKQARQETQLENAKAKLWEEFELSYIQAIDFKDSNFILSVAVKENREIKSRIKDIGQVNIGAIEEYQTVSKRYEFLIGQREDIVTSMEELNKLIGDMDKTIRKKFKESFDQVVENFEQVFQELYGGGHARIFFSDEKDPFDSEIEIIAQPPGKQLKHINLLSGGEKTMTAIALMFAVLKTKPTPCCILDEVEAALDDSNLNIFGKYLRQFQGVQFTLITHQKATMEHADVMYGITMPESGVSKVYSLKLEEAPVN